MHKWPNFGRTSAEEKSDSKDHDEVSSNAEDLDETPSKKRKLASSSKDNEADEERVKAVFQAAEMRRKYGTKV